LPPPPPPAEVPKPWGEVIGMALVINLCTLLGVVFLALPASWVKGQAQKRFEAFMCAFAAGALLSCAVFLLLFESTHYVAFGYPDLPEVEWNWRWGTMVLSGFILSSVIDSCSTLLFVGRSTTAPQAEDAVSDSKGSVYQGQPADTISRSESARVRGGVLIGDFMHNLVDGFFLGVAFLYCPSAGYKMAGMTIVHEIAQELADFVILTGPKGKLKPKTALTLNFVSGLSVLLGGIIVLAVDVDSAAIGLLLAFGGGVYIHVAATEAMPIVYSNANTATDRFICVLLFMVGAVLIALVLIDHQHCSKPSSALIDSCTPAEAVELDPHAGHDHGR